MQLLLDTHIFLWMINSEAPLSKKSIVALLDPKNHLFLSAASYWEICIKISIGKLTLGKSWKRTMDRELEYNGIQWLPIRKEHAQAIFTLPGIHKDPFDRILIAQAKCEKMPLITADRNIQKYPVQWIW